MRFRMGMSYQASEAKTRPQPRAGSPRALNASERAALDAAMIGCTCMVVRLRVAVVRNGSQENTPELPGT